MDRPVVPSVSIVVPVYNGARTIAACLESLLAQRYPADRHEIMVVENGSTDDTSAIVSRYPVTLLHSPERGPAPARNLGLAHSAADLIAFTDADCVATPDWLANLVAGYTEPEIVGVGGSILALAHPDRNLVERFSDEFSPLVNFSRGDYEFLPALYTANASFRRAALQQVGGFNPQLLTGEDVDLSWRLQLQTGQRLAYAESAVIYHHHRATVKNLARQYWHYGFGEILLDTRFGPQPGYPRDRGFVLRRMLGQSWALPRYLLSGVLRGARLALGRATRYQALTPWLWLVIEFSSLRGKAEGLWATRGMTTADHVLAARPERLIARLYGDKKTI